MSQAKVKILDFGSKICPRGHEDIYFDNKNINDDDYSIELGEDLKNLISIRGLDTEVSKSSVIEVKKSPKEVPANESHRSPPSTLKLEEKQTTPTNSLLSTAIAENETLNNDTVEDFSCVKEESVKLETLMLHDTKEKLPDPIKLEKTEPSQTCDNHAELSRLLAVQAEESMSKSINNSVLATTANTSSTVSTPNTSAEKSTKPNLNNKNNTPLNRFYASNKLTGNTSTPNYANTNLVNQNNFKNNFYKGNYRGQTQFKYNKSTDDKSTSFVGGLLNYILELFFFYFLY